jgi:hypothetical protein
MYETLSQQYRITDRTLVKQNRTSPDGIQRSQGPFLPLLQQTALTAGNFNARENGRHGLLGAAAIFPGPSRPFPLPF